MMHLLKRTMAFVLTFVLCAEALLGGGVASAIALSASDTPAQQAVLLSGGADAAAAAGVTSASGAKTDAAAGASSASGAEASAASDIGTIKNSAESVIAPVGANAGESSLNGAEVVARAGSSSISPSGANADAGGAGSADSGKAASVDAGVDGSTQAVLAAAVGSSAQPAPVVAAVGGADGVSAPNTLGATIDVFWASVDDEGDDVFDADDNRVWTQDPSQYKSHAATTKVRVLRNGTDAAELEVTGEADDTAHEASIGGDAFTWRETAPWRVQVSALPECDANGVKYSYLFLEEPASGFTSKKDAERGIDTESGSLYVRFCNARADGGGITIVPVYVRWVDGGDTSSRMPIEVGLYAKREIRSDDGWLVYDKDQCITKANLSKDNSWYNEMNVAASGLDVKNDFYIAELSTLSDGDEAQGRYEVISRDEVASGSPENPGYAAILRNWPESDSSSRLLSADPNQGFAYRVTYGRNDVLGSHEVTNQRIGFTEVAISRTWLDEGIDESARPKSTFTLASSGGGVEFAYDAGGVVYAEVSGHGYELYKKDASGALAPLTISREPSDVTVSASGSSLTVSSDAFGDLSTYVIANLPEYDAQGAPISWAVEQNWVDNHSDYQTIGGAAKQTRVSPWHQEDQLTFSFVNDRAATLAGKVLWVDQGNEFGLRPASVSLKLTRAYQDGSPDDALAGGEVALQTSDPTAPNYLVWTAQSPSGDAWTYEIRNLEKWAPDGKLWKYTVAESPIDSQYEIKTGTDNGGSCDSAAGELPSITNELKKLVTVGVSGIAIWNAPGSGLAVTFDPVASGVGLKVFRSVAGGPEALVTSDGEGAELEPSWNANGDGAWAYSLEGLPKYDENGREYTYRVEIGEVSGWRFVGYDENGAAVYEPAPSVPGGAGGESGESGQNGGDDPGVPNNPNTPGGSNVSDGGEASSPAGTSDASASAADGQLSVSATPATGDYSLLLHAVLACFAFATLALSLRRLRS